MKAWVIKTKTGYIGKYDNTGYTEDATFINAYLFRTMQQAFGEASGGDKIIPVEIKIIKRKEKKKKRKIKIHYRTAHETIACGRKFMHDTFTFTSTKSEVTCDMCRNYLELRRKTK